MRSLVALLLLLSIALASSVPVSHTQPKAREGWTSIGEASSDTPVSLRLALTQQNLDRLEQRFWSVSDPDSPEYGQHMTPVEVAELVKPSEEDIFRLMEWLETSACISSHSFAHSGDYMYLSMDAACAQSLFAAKMHLFATNSTTGDITTTQQNVVVRSSTPVQLPAAWEGIVEGVHGLVQLPPTNTRFTAHTSRVGKSPYPGDTMTPPILAKAYGITGTGAHGQGVAVAEFEDSAFYPSDIQAFLANFSLPTANITRIVGEDDTYYGYLAEASLDVQYMMGLAPGVPAWAFMRGPFDLTDWALNVSSTEGAPKVHSISYGSKETAFELADMQRDNTEFMKLGAQGFTILVASGDSGTGHSGLFRCKGFAPNYPSTSPYVTSVGGTYITGADEDAWNYSGGGFSTAFPMPAYQTSAVSAYLKAQGSALPDGAFFNATNRAVPDISAAATNFQVIMQGFWDNEASGTSASAPVWAAVFSLLNDARAGVHKPPLGFVNPALYKLGDVGRDITTGEPNQDKPCKAGFAPAAGWDAVTGLGSPLYSKLVSGLVSSR